MFLEQHKTIRQKPEYPVLQKALGNDRGEFELLRAAYGAEDLKKHEERMATGSWDAKYLPGIIKEAKLRLAEKGQQKEGEKSLQTLG